VQFRLFWVNFAERPGSASHPSYTQIVADAFGYVSVRVGCERRRDDKDGGAKIIREFSSTARGLRDDRQRTASAHG
jgi:hypothetical protein